MGALVVAGLILVAAAGCSSSGEDDGGSASDRSSTSKLSSGSGGDDSSSTDDVSSSDDADSSGSAGDRGGDDGDGGYDDLSDLVGTCGAVGAVTVSLGLGAAFLTEDQKAELEGQLDELTAQVPDEIRGDVETVQQGAAQADSITEFTELLDSEEYRQAMENISAWVEANCNMESPFG
jgi:hypothetical protein